MQMVKKRLSYQSALGVKLLVIGKDIVYLMCIYIICSVSFIVDISSLLFYI